jgi:hypothetical protein
MDNALNGRRTGLSMRVDLPGVPGGYPRSCETY